MVMIIKLAEKESVKSMASESKAVSKAAAFWAQWEETPIQLQAAAFALVYILLALFPWLCATAAFAFAAGRQWGREWGYKQGYTDGALKRARCEAELATHIQTSAKAGDSRGSKQSTSQ